MKMEVTVHSIEDCGDHFVVKAQGRYLRTARWDVASITFRARPEIGRNYKANQVLDVTIVPTRYKGKRK